MLVYLKNKDHLSTLRHPVGNIGFIDMDTPANWPDDAYTYRRLKDGTVEAREEKPQSVQPEQIETQNPEQPIVPAQEELQRLADSQPVVPENGEATQQETPKRKR